MEFRVVMVNKLSQTFIIGLLFLILTTVAFSQVSNFKHWSVKQVENTKVYVPRNLESEKHYSITLFSPSYN